MAGKALTRRQFGVAAASAAVAGSASAQQRAGVPGSPDATTTIDGKHLPPPPQKFEGQINLNATQSKPYWPARVVPPKVPFRFTGKLHKVTIRVQPRALTPTEEQLLRREGQRSNWASE